MHQLSEVRVLEWIFDSINISPANPLRCRKACQLKDHAQDSGEALRHVLSRGVRPAVLERDKSRREVDGPGVVY